MSSLSLVESASEDFFEEGEGARILGLPEPEHGRFANRRILVRSCYLNRPGNTLIGRKLA